MTHQRSLQFSIETSRLRLSAREVPWDSDVFGTSVVQIEDLRILDQTGAIADYASFRVWLEAEGVGIVTCRLAHELLRESMLLEDRGFRFIEMVLHPRLDEIQALVLPEDDLEIAPAAEADLGALQGIAEQAFGYERYHVDPRLDRRLGDQRYGRWVRGSLCHPSQRLLKISDRDRLIGLFLVEIDEERLAHWHLTAIAPQSQGLGYGRRVWMMMLRRHQAEGCEAVTTTISARNTPVLNLYAQLRFRFMPPEMTFHWVREDP